MKNAIHNEHGSKLFTLSGTIKRVGWEGSRRQEADCVVFSSWKKPSTVNLKCPDAHHTLQAEHLNCLQVPGQELNFERAFDETWLGSLRSKRVASGAVYTDWDKELFTFQIHTFERINFRWFKGFIWLPKRALPYSSYDWHKIVVFP